MSNSFDKFFSETFPYKYWNIKDTYVVTPITEGNWWPIKKYIVFYIDILVNRTNVDKKLLQSIYENFEKFVNSFPDGEYKQKAYDYFLKDFNVNEILSFNEFCDLDGYEDIARKFYFMRLMNIGGQSALKKDIKSWLDQNKTLSEINDLQDKRKDYYIKRNVSKSKSVLEINVDGKIKKINGIIDKNGKKVSSHSTLSDFPASISRNQRQVFTKWGFLPHERDGVSSNQISELIYNCSSELDLISICDHQKLKLREGNPYSDRMINYNPNLSKEHEKLKANRIINDFYVNPFISLMDILNKLSNLEEEQWYISEYEYQHIISRMSPFNITECVDLILDFRQMNHSDLTVLEKRKKRRNITNRSVSGGFKKPLANLLYGYITYVSSKRSDFRNKNLKSFLKYDDKKYKITNLKIFNKYFETISELKKYLENAYKDLYRDISLDYEATIIKELSDLEFKVNELSKYKLKIQRDAKRSSHSYGGISDYVHQYMNGWSQYIQSIDLNLLNYCVSLNKLVIPYNPKVESNINVLEKNQHSSTVKISSYSTIKSLIERSGYEAFGLKGLIKNRNEFNKVKLKIKKDRLNGIFHRKKFNVENVDKCDSCFSKSKKNSLDLHHIIQHEIDGPDVDLNLVYLCKSCHDKFTFNTKEKSHTEGNSREQIINNLKKRGFISFKNFHNLVNENHIKQKHLDYLFSEKYISYVEWMDLRKTLRIKQKKEDKEKVLSKFHSNNDRWSRAMSEIFDLRINDYYINGKRNYHYPVDKCDGGCNSSIKEYAECHHVIPKSGSTNKKFKESYGDIPLNGPESEYNYVYLCKECHLKFTNHDPERKKIIEEIKNRGLISYQGILMMIYSGLIKKEQVNFLFKEGFIDKSDFDNLIIELNDYLQNQLN